MMPAFADFLDAILGNIIGGTTSVSINMATFIFIIVLVFALVSARLDFTAAFAIVSPGIAVAVFEGALHPAAFGVVVLVLGIAWGLLILALFK